MNLYVLLIGIALIMSIGLALGLFLVIRDTRRQQGRWGINPGQSKCPLCEEPIPMVRIPKSVQQALWGGWTCSQCGLELDKWGRPTPKQNPQSKWFVLSELERQEVIARAQKKQAKSEMPSEGIKNGINEISSGDHDD